MVIFCGIIFLFTKIMLDELYLKGVVYDVEIYKNFLLFGFYILKMKRYKQYIWYGNIDEREIIYEILLKRILIGFNNWMFDDAISNFLLENKNNKKLQILDVWNFAQEIIKTRKNPYRYFNNNLKYSYDILELIRAGYNVTSLKHLGIKLKHHTILDLPKPYDAIILPQEVNEIKTYNINDLEITNKGFEFCKNQLISREFLSKHYNTDLFSISDSGLGKKIFEYLYIEIAKELKIKINVKELRKGRTIRTSIEMKDIIYDFISFRTPEMIDYLENLKKYTLSYSDLQNTIEQEEYIDEDDVEEDSYE